MDKMIEFCKNIADQLEFFEKNNGVKVDVLRWGIGFKDTYRNTGEIIWGDPTERNVSVECHPCVNISEGKDCVMCGARGEW
jgi:hypothetical protein